MAREFPQYDIFRVDNDGTTIWLEPVMTLGDAQACPKEAINHEG